MEEYGCWTQYLFLMPSVLHSIGWNQGRIESSLKVWRMSLKVTEVPSASRREAVCIEYACPYIAIFPWQEEADDHEQQHHWFIHEGGMSAACVLHSFYKSVYSQRQFLFLLLKLLIYCNYLWLLLIKTLFKASQNPSSTFLSFNFSNIAVIVVLGDALIFCSVLTDQGSR